MKCNKCNSENIDGANFCAKCASNLTEVDVVDVVRKFIMVHGKSLKIGQFDTFQDDIFSPHLVLGKYSIKIDNKFYVAEVRENIEIRENKEVAIIRRKILSKSEMKYQNNIDV